MTKPSPSLRKGMNLLLAASTVWCLSAPPASAGYKLGVADRVKIKIQEWPDLSGEYAVNPEGSVSIPLLGDIEAVGREASQLGRDVSRRLQQRGTGGDRPIASVEIVTFRPIFIIGDVDHPGQYPYRPGMTVLQAIGVAGGHYRPPNPGLMRLDRDVAVAEGDLKTYSAKLNRLQAKAARLQAAIDDQKDVNFPEDILKAKDNPTVASIMAEERATLAVDVKAKEQDQQALETIKALYQQEIANLRGQVAALKREQDTILRQLQELRALASKGLGLTPSLVTLERQMSQLSNEQLSLETAAVRSQEVIAQAEQKLPEAALIRRQENLKLLGEAKDDMREVQTRIATARALLLEASITAPREALANEESSSTDEPIILVRRENGVTREIVADETTAVEPDDVIKIPRSGPRKRNSVKPGVPAR